MCSDKSCSGWNSFIRIIEELFDLKKSAAIVFLYLLTFDVMNDVLIRCHGYCELNYWSHWRWLVESTEAIRSEFMLWITTVNLRRVQSHTAKLMLLILCKIGVVLGKRGGGVLPFYSRMDVKSCGGSIEDIIFLSRVILSHRSLVAALTVYIRNELRRRNKKKIRVYLTSQVTYMLRNPPNS